MEILTNAVVAILGLSLNPEIWVAAIVVIAFGRTVGRFLIALAIAALILVSLQALLTDDYQGTDALLTVLYLTVWSSVGWGVRSLLERAASA
jgi:hypothetical protein